MFVKDVYINGLSAISAQATFDESFLNGSVQEQHEAYRKAQDPDYKQYLNPTASRRFGRLIKMSLVSAQKSLANAGIKMPEAIITGTGLGCLEDTEKFLSALIESEETLLSPTAFIQSTHNTISGQIAMMLKCNYPNYTYSNRYFSFESSLLDGILMMADQSCKIVMVHAADEVIPNVHSILKRMKLWDRGESIQQNPLKKVAFGEGVVNMILSAEKSAASLARIKGLKLYYQLPDGMSVQQMAVNLFQECDVQADDIDVLIVGMNGEESSDLHYQSMITALPDATVLTYKQLFGEFFTASAFAYWLGAQVMYTNTVPAACIHSGELKKKNKHILLYNQFRGKYHSLCLLSDVEI
ncbi:MAG: beta-ketoacyl synthase chain length factor [Cytophagales bacterium]|nr:beta-ketoacyl synthase chain length factor [Cytophaga sp.]